MLAAVALIVRAVDVVVGGGGLILVSNHIYPPVSDLFLQAPKEQQEIEAVDNNDVVVFDLFPQALDGRLYPHFLTPSTANE